MDEPAEEKPSAPAPQEKPRPQPSAPVEAKPKAPSRPQDVPPQKSSRPKTPKEQQAPVANPKPVKKQESAPALKKTQKFNFPYSRYPEKYAAFVTTKTAKAFTKPDASSALALQLRQGDQLKVVGESGEFYKLEYLIGEEFLVEAWILKAQAKPVKNPALIPDSPREQDYQPTQRETAVATKAEDVPELRSGAPVQLKEETGKKQKKLIAQKKPALQKSKPSVRVQDRQNDRTKAQGPWAWNLSLNLGFSRINEKVDTATEASADRIQFLDYQLNGLSILSEAEATYEVLPELRVGGKAGYLFEILTSSVPSGSTSINNSGVTAQFHDVAIGPFVEYSMVFSELGIKFKPDLWLSGHMQIMNPNQLQDSLRAQPVLFGHLAFYGRALVSPKADFPFGLSLRPQAGAIFLYSFTESPTQEVSTSSTTSESIRTGSPKATNLALQYGGEMAWGLQVLGFKNNEFFFRGFYKSFPKKFSGSGNRAGIRTQDAESKFEKIELGIGYRHFF